MDISKFLLLSSTLFFSSQQNIGHMGHFDYGSLNMYYIQEWPSKLRIKNSIKPHGVQHILRHFYYTTMQKLSKFEALSWPENQCKCHKGNP